MGFGIIINIELCSIFLKIGDENAYLKVNPINFRPKNVMSLSFIFFEAFSQKKTKLTDLLATTFDNNILKN